MFYSKIISEIFMAKLKKEIRRVYAEQKSMGPKQFIFEHLYRKKIK